MHNLVTDASSVSEANKSLQEAKWIFAEGNMNSQEWFSNNDIVDDAIPSGDQTDDEHTCVGTKMDTKDE